VAPGTRGALDERSVYAHAIANFGLLSFAGPKMPEDLKNDMEKTVTSKAEVISWLKRSLIAVKEAQLAVKPGDLQRQVQIHGVDTDVEAIYLRILVHANEHMGQLVGYARITGVAPPPFGPIDACRSQNCGFCRN